MERLEMNRATLLVGLSGLIVFFVFLRYSNQRPVGHNSIPAWKPAEESADDPIERARQEWMELRDPSTNEIPPGIRSKELAFAGTLPSVESFVKSRLQKEQLMSWTSRGPFNQGGRTRALAFDVSDATGNTILAGGVSGGMWRSTDGGTTWTRATSLDDSVQSVSCLAQDPRPGNQNIWYYGTGEYLGNSAGGGGGDAYYNGDGIYKSTNDGISWQKLTSTASWTPQVFDKVSDFVWDIVVDPTNGNVYAAAYGQIIRSTDGGSTWGNSLGSTVSSGFSTYTDIAVTSGGVFYAAESSDGVTAGFYRSTSGASGSWKKITPSGWPSTYNRVVVTVATANESLVYFLGDTPGSGYQDPKSGDYTSFWKYTDNGSGTGTWADRSANLPNYGGQVGNFSHQGGYDLIVRTKPDNPNFVYIGGTNLYRSSDGFADTMNSAWIGGYSTANNVSLYPGNHCDEHALAFSPSNPAVMLSGSDGGISKTTNDSASSVSWTYLNNGYLTTQFYSVAIDMSASGDQTIIGGMQDNGNMFLNSGNGATPWVKLPFGGDGGITQIANGKSSYYISTQNGDAERVLLDAGGNYTDYAGVKPSGGTGFLFVTPFVLDPNNSDMMYMAAGGHVWRNSDLTAIPTASHGGSQNATSVNWADLTNAAVAGHDITALGISTSPANRLYYGTDSSQVFRLDGANSGNPTPTNVTGSGFPIDNAFGRTFGAYVKCIAVNPRNADSAIVVFSNYNILSLFFTANGGTSWSAIGGNLEQHPDGSGNGPSCSWATILPKGGGVEVFVATSTGLYSTGSINGMSTVWALEGSSVIGNAVMKMVLSRATDGLVVAATHGDGVFSAQAVTNVQAQSDLTPRAYSLSQNYPNPFNPTTRIQYAVPREGHVRITVYDVAGREIAILVDGNKAAGNYIAAWDGRSMNGVQAASGVYFCRLDAAGFTATRKMLMLK